MVNPLRIPFHCQLMVAVLSVCSAAGAQENNRGPLLQLIGVADSVSRVRITERDGYRWIEANGIPDHQVGRFPNRNNPNRISEQRYRFRMSLTPNPGRTTSNVGMNLFGVALNGVPFDPGAAEFW